MRSPNFFPCISWGSITSSPGLYPPLVTGVQGSPMHTTCLVHTARHSKELTCLKQLTGAALKPCSCRYFPQSKPRTSAISRHESRKSGDIIEKAQRAQLPLDYSLQPIVACSGTEPSASAHRDSAFQCIFPGEELDPTSSQGPAPARGTIYY